MVIVVPLFITHAPKTYQVECLRCQRDREPVQDAGELLLWRRLNETPID